MNDGSQGEAPPRRKRWACLWLAVAVGTLPVCCAGGVGVMAVQHEVRSRLATYDAVVTLGVEDANQRARVLRVLKRRLRRAGILSRLGPGSDPAELDVHLRGPDVEAARTLLLRSGRLRFMLVVGDSLSAERRQEERARISEAKAAGTYDPDLAPYDLLPAAWAEELLLVERTPMASDDFDEFHASFDGTGRGWLAFTLSPAGGEQLRALTSPNVGRMLAVVFEDRIRTAPVIRAPITRKGVIEGGPNGWDEQELDALVDLLNAGELPCALTWKGVRPPDE